MKLQKLEHPKLDKKEYEKELEKLQLQLMTLQHDLYNQNMRCVVVVEGIDAAGKGGMIRRMTEFMDPRGVRVHPIGAPSIDELEEHYMQRFWRLLPKRGEVSIFDRSWYGRVLVERVDNLTPHKRWQRAYKEISQFEKLLINDGVIVIKLFLSISKDEQLKRFKERIENPKKRWKITSEDILNRQNWDSYQQAFEDMLDKTDGKKNPWHIVAANNKRYARINAMKHFAKRLNAHIDTEQVELLKPEVEKLATKYLP
ncbi:hypothetical protein A3762_13185 [Oleiphilus sp. HI0125]|uniref:polyphosphate kinase 2 family protein n=2 Tax=Oleiphilus sp. HI0125 TaxID=1822266 RepID=UPI0007C39ED2|nr:hypothetical protein [Oleiphilus sp. HI0125]KZZ62639.1 hypothetical protein A3762_13185 [Oleiphilus sp. HI0125]